MSDKKEHLIDTAITLFSQEGVSVPTAKIAKEARVSNGTLFNHFPTKQALIDATYLSIKRDFGSYILHEIESGMPIKDLLQHIWNSYTHWAIDHPLRNQVVVLLRTAQVLSDEALGAADEIFQRLSKRLKDAVKNEELVNMPTEYIYEITGAQISATIAYATKNDLRGKKLQQFIDRGFAMYWNGVKG